MIKNYKKFPTTEDKIVFDIEIIENGDYVDPFSIDRIEIKHIKRNPFGINNKTYNVSHYDIALVQDFKKVSDNFKNNPNKQNSDELDLLKLKLKGAVVKHEDHYQDAELVYFTEDTGNINKKQRGIYEFSWEPKGQKGGDYFVTLLWRKDKDGSQKATTDLFYVNPAKNKLSCIPGQHTIENKYDILLDAYTPKMFKYKITADDMSPFVLSRINRSIAQGFTHLEDMALQLIDSYDANIAQESALPFLANFFNLKLKSNDITLWRKQIKQAVPLLKAKGTLTSLQIALDQAGINLRKFTQLWQIVSNYVQIDSFLVEKEDNDVLGKLSYVPVNEEFELSIASHDGKIVKIPNNYVALVEDNGVYLVVWNGINAEPPISLFEDDLILIKYFIREIPPERLALEDYIQSLPLMDDRDFSKQRYPLKNWNVHLIEEDDLLFDLVINDRHPFNNQISWGKTRTTFLYSENVYNMDSFNGTLRNSLNPCDIDKDFVDSCNYCQSSKFSVDIEIYNLSDERIEEAKEIIMENVPFHSMLHSLNVSGIINDFAITQENVDTLAETEVSDSIGKPNAVKEIMKNQESISFDIEWEDGRVEKKFL